MTKKSAVKKPAARARPKRAPAVKGHHVSGGIHAGRDVIMGDQYNDFRQQVAHIASPQEFLARAHELQAKVAEIKRQPDLLPAQVETLEVVEGQVQQVVEEAQKPKPLGARITATLTGAKAVMDSLGEGVKSAIGLGGAIAGLGQIALKLFGG
jgi:hypothetical protein